MREAKKSANVLGENSLDNHPTLALQILVDNAVPRWAHIKRF